MIHQCVIITAEDRSNLHAVVSMILGKILQVYYKVQFANYARRVYWCNVVLQRRHSNRSKSHPNQKLPASNCHVLGIKSMSAIGTTKIQLGIDINDAISCTAFSKNSKHK